MKIYIAASYPRQAEAIKLAYKLMKHRGDVITSGWLEQEDKNANPCAEGRTPPVHEQRNKAERDLGHIEIADVLIMITGDNLSGGGRRTEYGFALGLRKPVIIYGPKEIIFDSVDAARHVDDINTPFTHLCKQLKTIEEKIPQAAPEEE